MAVLPVTVNLSAYRGDTWAQSFILKDDADTPHDLVTASVESWARSRKDDTVLTLVVSVGPDPGMVTLALPQDVDAGLFDYDVEVEEEDGAVTTWVRGKLAVAQDVTNADG